VTAPLAFQGTTKLYGQQTALDQLSLTLERGEILGFLGPNGAGKTTAIHLAMGFLRPSSGEGTILGHPFGDTRIRSQVGFLPDAPTFFSGSARESVELAGRLNDMRQPRLRERAVGLLSQLNLSASGKDARRFSRGMQQRLGLAQALVNDPELLILDEPTSALDPPGVLEVRELLRAVRDEGKSIFFSSHQLSEVEQVCDRIAFLGRGRLLRHGPLTSFLAESGRVEIVLRGLPPEAEVLRQNQMYVSGSATEGVRLVVPENQKRPVIEQAWVAGGELVSVAPLRRTLEELFVDWSTETQQYEVSAE